MSDFTEIIVLLLFGAVCLGVSLAFVLADLIVWGLI